MPALNKSADHSLDVRFAWENVGMGVNCTDVSGSKIAM
jgi:hypothetical protein